MMMVMMIMRMKMIIIGDQLGRRQRQLPLLKNDDGENDYGGFD